MELLKLVTSKVKFIILCTWIMFIFGLWLVMSLFIGTEGQWWSIFYIHPEKYGPMALELSYLRISLFVLLSIIGLYVISYSRKYNIK